MTVSNEAQNIKTSAKDSPNLEHFLGNKTEEIYFIIVH
jgi:hypothetical protein